MKLGKMMIFVPDLEEAKRFYRDVLGFPLKSESNNNLVFAHQGCDFIAFKCEQHGSADEYSKAARSVFVFEVDSIDESYRRLKERGVEFLHDTPAENEFCRYAAFVDPFGNVHEISQSTHPESK